MSIIKLQDKCRKYESVGVKIEILKENDDGSFKAAVSPIRSHPDAIANTNLFILMLKTFGNGELIDSSYSDPELIKGQAFEIPLKEVIE